MKDIIGRFGKDLEKHLIEKGRQEREKEIIELGDKLLKTYVIDKKGYFWRELKEQIKETKQ